jgi:hypothetical protein
VATLEEKVAQLEARLAGDKPPAEAGPLVEPPAGAKAVDE